MHLTVGQPILAAAGFQPAPAGIEYSRMPACPTKPAELRPHYTSA
jgi:hypothetical protein